MPKSLEVNVILLVEDSEDDILITQRKLFRSSLKIKDFLVAKTLAEAIEIVEHVEVDIVLLDLNMPEKKGLDTLEEFKKYYNGIIIVCTSLEDELTGIRAIRMGADDYLVKSELSEHTLSRSVTYSKERRKLRTSLQSARETVDKLHEIATKQAGA